jgi:peroxiredoxin
MWTLDGSPVSLDALRGKVVILNFWRQNCRWCHLEKRYLRSLVRDLNRSDLQVVCANLWDHPGWIRRYAERESEGLLFTTRGDDPRCVVENVVKGRLMGYYVVNGAKEAIYEVKGFPTSYVIDGDGRVVATHVGMVRWDSRSILDWIAGLVGRDKGQEAVAGAEYRSPAWLDRLMTTGVGRP